MHDVKDMEAIAQAADLKGKLAKVAEFNSLVVGFPIPERPQLLSEDRQAFRQGFLKEEMDEIDKAFREGDLEEVVDGHIDAIYVHLGALVEMGVTPNACFDEVHSANMAKKRGAQSKRGKSGGFDAVKPEGWKKPSHAEFLTVSTQDVRDVLDVRRAVASITWHQSGVVEPRNRKADIRNITAEELDLIGKLRSGEVKVDLNREERRREQQEAGKDVYKEAAKQVYETKYVRQVQANDDFEYVGHNATAAEKQVLVGQTGYVLSVDEGAQQADVRFYSHRLPDRMTVSLREVKYLPKAARGMEVSEGTQTLVLSDVQAVAAGGSVGPFRFALFHDEPKKPKVLVLGYARHGKDTVSELLRDKYGLSFTSSSAFCAERVILPKVKALWEGPLLDVANPGPYKTAQEAFDDRHNHRAFWYDSITEFNTPDLTSLGRAIFEGHDVYCGLRNAREFHALKNAGVFDVCIWVDAYERVGSKEDPSSCTVEPWMADFVVDNNGSLADLERNLAVVMGRHV